MTDSSVERIIEDIYSSLHNENEDIDTHIDRLKRAMAETGQKEAVFKTDRLAQGNREGRKIMQSYFRKRGVAVVFDGAKAG